jgi:ribonucleoside-diphosphate reductase alpha chain
VPRRLPRTRRSETLAFQVGDTEATLTTDTYPDGRLGQIFLRLDRHGSTMAGVTDAFSIATSLALQHGADLGVLAEELRGMRFDPAGATDDAQIPSATSVMDYLARRLGADFT